MSARLRELPREAALITAAVAVYFGVRGQTVANPQPAFDNAQRVADLEADLGLDVEQAVQESFLTSDVTVDVMNWVYIWGHWPVIAGVLTWLFFRHPAGYRLTRGAMILSGAVGLLVFAFFPVAPPRLVDPELVDTVTEKSQAYRVLQPPAFTNPYAAMPSLHVGWDLLVGIALVVYARWVVLRVIGVVLPLMMAVAVVATANHYLLDGVAGVLLVLAALALTRWATARSDPAEAVVPVPGQRDPGAVPRSPRRDASHR